MTASWEVNKKSIWNYITEPTGWGEASYRAQLPTRLEDGAGIYPAGILCGSEIERTFWNNFGWAELTRLSWSGRTKKMKFPGGKKISAESSGAGREARAEKAKSAEESRFNDSLS